MNLSFSIFLVYIHTFLGQISDGSSPGQSLALNVELEMSPSQSLAGPLPNFLGLSQKDDPEPESSPGPSKNLEP